MGTDSGTNEGYGNFGSGLAGVTAIASARAKSVALLETACTANVTQTMADGVSGNICTKTDLGIADATITAETTTETNDTVQWVHTHTAGEPATLKGAIFCNDANDKILLITCYSAEVGLATSDTLKNTGQIIWVANPL